MKLCNVGARDLRMKMSKKFMVLLLTMGVLVGLTAGYIGVGLQAYSRYQHGDGSEHCGGQAPVRICVQVPATIFSAFYVSYVARHSALFTIKYSSSKPVTLLVSANLVGFSQVQTQTVRAIPAAQSVAFTPPLLSHILQNFTSEHDTSLHVWVTDMQGQRYYSNDSPLVLYSRLQMQWMAASRLQIAAWVTPDDPEIVALVDKATTLLQEEPPPAPQGMIGYKNASPEQVAAQVDAIFDALRIDYQIQYVETSVPYAGPADSRVGTQAIKLPSEVLQQHSGMGVELTVLLASAVENSGLHAEIVIIPGHAFLGVAVASDDLHFQYWDAMLMNDNVTGAAATTLTDAVYAQHLKQHTIVDTILISDARKANIGPMV